MELKPYQQQVINDLTLFLEEVQKTKDVKEAFYDFWLTHPKTPLQPFPGTAVEPYKNNIPRVPHVCIKVPTAGGKTFIACNALKTIFDAFDSGRSKTVVWLVPSITILDQTIKNLKNPAHPYRQKINTHFGNKVEVFDKAALLQGSGFNATSVKEQLSILMFSFDSLRAKNKEDRKVFQENGNLQSFESLLGREAEITLGAVIKKLNPVVVVDESHNAESTLSVDMLKELNPSFILDLTATPRNNSNIISFIDALELKKENMVKLPVIVYNHQDKTEVINSALQLQKRLEQQALAEEKKGGKYIRPIVLFQAQPKNSEDNTTFEKLKEKLIELKIPAEQIRIKTANLNEIRNEDLLSKACPVRYIITVNALKEGWDCPFAYILASLADKSSAVDVEQILGRVLRQPYVMKHNFALLNLSYVLTASARFLDTLDNIVKGLNKAGFSDKDYKVAEAKPESLSEFGKVGSVDFRDLFSSPQQEDVLDDDIDVARIANWEEIQLSEFGKVGLEDLQDMEAKGIQSSEFGKVGFMDLQDLEAKGIQSSEFGKVGFMDLQDMEAKGIQPSINPKNPNSDILTAIEKTAAEQITALERTIREMETETAVPNEIQKLVKNHPIKEVFAEQAQQLQLPAFYLKVPSNDLFGINEALPLEKEDLLKGFALSKADTHVAFDNITSELYRVDLDETKKEHTPTFVRIDGNIKESLMTYLLDPTKKESRVKHFTKLLMERVGNLYPIADKEIEKYINRILEDFKDEQFNHLVSNEYTYTDKIKAKIKSLSEQFAERKFKEYLDTDKVFIQASFTLPKSISPVYTSKDITKSLYEKEASMNSFEERVINEIGNMQNIAFWTRNLERKGFRINGFINHYPDFIIRTKSGKTIILETKGDHLDAEQKIRLGSLWANKAGNNYRYFMVYERRNVEGSYKLDEFLNLIKEI